jgi:hypothetical protein
LVTSKERFIGDTSSLFISFLFSLSLSLSLSLLHLSHITPTVCVFHNFFFQKTKKDGEEEKGSAENNYNSSKNLTYSHFSFEDEDNKLDDGDIPQEIVREKRQARTYLFSFSLLFCYVRFFLLSLWHCALKRCRLLASKVTPSCLDLSKLNYVCTKSLVVCLLSN